MEMTHENLAEALWQARLSQTPIPPLTEAKELSIEQAYEISKTNFLRRLKGKSVQKVGKKIGLTSQAVQNQLEVSEPDFGYLTSDMMFENKATIPIHPLIQPRVEGEVAMLLSQDLEGEHFSEEELRGAVEAMAPCIEIIDSRVADWKIKIQDTVADNASSAFFVLGDWKKDFKDIDLVQAKMTLQICSITRSTGEGAACLGNPFLALAWLAAKMSFLGDPLRKGEIVLTGAFGPVVPIQKEDDCEVFIEGLGKVSCEFQ